MIEIKGLYAGYGEKKILKDINFSCKGGEITVIIGPNGCGKSTLLKNMVGLVQRTSGEIFVEGKAMEEYSAKELARNISYLPQNKKVTEITVLKMVLHGRFCYLNYPRKYSRKDMEIAMQALRDTGLEEYAHESVSKLSGGMQQKVHLAMALAQDTKVILMDEPTTYLDIGWQLRLMGMVKQLAEKGKSLVLVLHDLAQALQVADQVLVMEKGQMVQMGTPEEIVESKILSKVFGIEPAKVLIRGKQYYVMTDL